MSPKKSLVRKTYNLRPRTVKNYFPKTCHLNSRKDRRRIGTDKQEKKVRETGTVATLCTICQDTQKYKRIKKVSCGHTFHLQCINNWLKQSESCPICRCCIGNRPETPSGIQSDQFANIPPSVTANLTREVARASVSISFFWIT